jgi:heat-inducible transcriptional repressor
MKGAWLTMELTARKQKILACVVNSYAASGEPVGSKLIAEEVGVSSATVRNEMAELIEMGLLEQPHTSAGRVPSQQGYREYINGFMEHENLPPQVKLYYDAYLAAGEFDPEKLLVKASEALASATRFTAAAITPSGMSAKITAVQFVQISRRAAMLILMSSAGTMKTRVFHCEFDLSAEIMRIFFRVFNEKVTGKPVSSINPAFIQNLGISFGELTMIMSSALMALLEAATETMRSDVIVSGQMNLLLYPEYTHGSVRRIVDILEDNDEVNLLLSCKPGKVTSLLGTESGRPELKNSALIISRYLINGQDSGAIAVVGPMRMNYPQTIESIRYVADNVGRMLTSLMKEE